MFFFVQGHNSNFTITTVLLLLQTILRYKQFIPYSNQIKSLLVAITCLEICLLKDSFISTEKKGRESKLLKMFTFLSILSALLLNYTQKNTCCYNSNYRKPKILLSSFLFPFTTQYF